MRMEGAAKGGVRAYVFVDSSGWALRPGTVVIGVELGRLPPLVGSILRKYLRDHLGRFYHCPLSGREQVKLRIRGNPILDVIDWSGLVAHWDQQPAGAPTDPEMTGWPPVRPRAESVELEMPMDLPQASGEPVCKLEELVPLCHNSEARVREEDLLGPPSPTLRTVAPSGSVEETFVLGGITLSVRSNVYLVDRGVMRDLALLRALGASGDPRQAVERIFARLGAMLEKATDRVLGARLDSENEVGSEVLRRLHELRQRVEECWRSMAERSVEGMLAELPELLEWWDRQVREIQREWESTGRWIVDESGQERPSQAALPLRAFVRTGMFLPRPRKLPDGREFSAGCYVLVEERSEEDVKRTRAHELAHAAMAVRRSEGALHGCRWLEEGFADYLAAVRIHGRDEAWLGLEKSWTELDIYCSWTYLLALDAQGGEKVEELLQRYLDDAKPKDFCKDVRKLRRTIHERFGY